ncbi:hypothetical protein [Endozoicomonas sp. ALC013]|uniref:hypothetical protein n=1 Tax=Endozoicomonas sp. ALC013 TaxID=3403076 RepID=UPI003BB81613
MDDLFHRLQNTSPDNEEDQSVIAMAARWLGRPCPFVLHYQTTRSKPQAGFRNQLQSPIPSLKIEEGKCLNSLPPVDLLLPDHNMVIEIQGPSHYVSGDYKTRNGSTLLKKAGLEVIEIPVGTWPVTETNLHKIHVTTLFLLGKISNSNGRTFWCRSSR